jgi:hypothetical protein
MASAVRASLALAVSGASRWAYAGAEPVSEDGSMSSAVRQAPSPEQQRAQRRRARDRALKRDGVILVVTLVALALLWPHRLVPNADLPLAEQLTAEMGEVYRAVRAGDLDLAAGSQEVADGIVGASFERGGGTLWVVTGRAGADCYAMWWDADGTRRTRTVPTTLPCEPASELTSSRPTTFDRIGQATREGADRDPWLRVLPDAWHYRVWFIPAVIVGVGLALSAAVRMTIALLIDNAPSAVRR